MDGAGWLVFRTIAAELGYRKGCGEKEMGWPTGFENGNEKPVYWGKKAL